MIDLSHNTRKASAALEWMGKVMLYDISLGTRVGKIEVISQKTKISFQKQDLIHMMNKV